MLTGEGSDELLAGYGKYPRALVNWRAGAAYGAGARRRSARLDRGHAGADACPAGSAAMRARSFLADAADAGGDVLRQLRRDRARAPAALLVARPCGHRDDSERPTAPRAALRRGRTAQHDCSTACSTPT